MPTDKLNNIRQAAFLKKIQCMKEVEFTAEVIMPLFNKLGYSVDHHGGQFEGGKDVICWRSGDFGARELAVIQVKRVKLSAAAKSQHSFSETITQLQQAIEKPVPYLDGLSRKPDKIFFITPYQIETRILESRFEGMSALMLKGVKVLDGILVYEELARSLPTLIDTLCGEDFSIKHSLLTNNISNADLLSALNYSGEKNIEDFYCDLDFSVGRLTSKLFFALNFCGKREKHNLDAISWDRLKNTCTTIFNQTGIDIIEPTTDAVISHYNKELLEWESPSNRSLINQVHKLTTEIESTLDFMVSSCGDLVNDAVVHAADSLPFGPRTIRKFTESELERLDNLKQAKLYLDSEYTSWLDQSESSPKKLAQTKRIIDSVSAQLGRLRNEGFIINIAEAGRLTELLRNIKVLNKHYNDLSKIAPAVKKKPEYEFSINGASLENTLLAWRKEVVDGISSISRRPQAKKQIKPFFERCQLIFGIVAEILDFKMLSEAVGINVSQKFAINSSANRIHMPMKEVFSAGIDCAVYGEAGAGKSTTLFNYASEASGNDKPNEITLFLPLTRLMTGLRAFVDDEIATPADRLKQRIATFLNTKGNNTNSEILKFLETKSKIVFVLDGVDEVIKTSPWVVDAIKGLKVSYPNAQIILSARSSGRYLDNLNYLGLTILPFSDDQVIGFVRGWFKSQQYTAEAVLSHLSATKSLFEIVRNPLLATVLCVLAENQVPLPAGELSLYAERMKLLLGHYDIHKKSKRLATHSVVLIAAARKLAFQLHSRGVRSAPPEVLEDIAIKALKNHKFEGVKDAEIRVAVRELLDPCNVLTPMTDEGDIGFGHLRFQEYLCAEELCQNRGIDILPLLRNPWWKATIVLFGRLTDDIEPIINDVLQRQVSISGSRDTLMALIETRGKVERRELKQLIDSHMKLDRLSEDLTDYDNWDNDDY